MLRIAFLLLGMIALDAFLLGPVLAHFEVISSSLGLAICVSGSILGAIVFFVGIGVAAKNGPKSTYIAMLMGGIPFVFLLFSFYTSTRYPMINDVSTESIYPPIFVYAKTLPENADRDMSLSEEAKIAIAEHYSDLSPLPLLGEADELFMKISELAREEPGWAVERTTFDPKDSTIEGVATSMLFGFKDDFVIRVTTTEGGAVVDMRSRSRDGKGDMGANVKRIRAFMAKLPPLGETSSPKADEESP